jgi:glycosyltransferase involved in cell wall biosynthesis
VRVAYITAGAAGMFCGSCVRDNALVAGLRKLGHDALLVPTYTPIRTDDLDLSVGRVFLGGISVYLEQKSALFRVLPRWLTRWLDHPAIIRLATERAGGGFDYAELAALTESMLAGDHGRQRDEVAELAAWLRAEVRPEVVVLTNALLSGIVPTVAKELGVPILTTLQGDDIFLDALPTDSRRRCVEAIRRNDEHTAGYVATSRFYADHMAGYLGVDRAKVAVVWPGINLTGHGGVTPRPDRPPTVGYFARICPEKGFQNAVAAFLQLKRLPGMGAAKFRAAGWLGPQHRAFFAEQVRRLDPADFEHVDCPDHDSKVRFLQGVDVLSVPTDYREPKGLYLLEAWANGVPVVQPAHGSFPELVEATGGGLLVAPGDPDALAHGLAELLGDEPRRRAMGERANAVVRERFSAAAMAEATVGVLNKHVRPA